MMRKLYTLFFAFAGQLILLSGCGRGPVRPEPSLELIINDFENLQYRWNVQGCAVHGDYFFSLHDKGACVVVDLGKKELVSQFRLASAGANNHANTAFFGQQKYAPEDLFPLLYVSQCKSEPVGVTGHPETDSLSRLCFVERVLSDEAGVPCGTQLVQVICPVLDEYTSSLWISDPYDPDHIWCFGNTTGNRRKDNHIVLRRFDFPRFDPDRFLVTLTESDVQERFALDECLPAGARGPQDCTLQGGCIRDGIFYMPVGSGKKYPAELFCFDLDPKYRDGKHFRYAHFDYTDVAPYELEDADVWGDRLVIHVNNMYGRDNRILSFSLRDLRKSVR